MNTDENALYLIDTKERILFNAVKSNGRFELRKTHVERTPNELIKLEKLLSRFSNNDPSILVLPKTGKFSQFSTQTRKRTQEEIDLSWKVGEKVASELNQFLSENNIDLNKCELIE